MVYYSGNIVLRDTKFDMKFETISGSLYEVDEENSRCRRLIGVADPQPRQGKDGEWKTFDTMSEEVKVGEPVLFVWWWEGEIAKSTVTSAVRRILKEEN